MAHVAPYLSDSGRAVLEAWAAAAAEQAAAMTLSHFACVAYIDDDSDSSTMYSDLAYRSPRDLLDHAADSRVDALFPQLPASGWPDPDEWRLSHV